MIRGVGLIRRGLKGFAVVSTLPVIAIIFGMIGCGAGGLPGDVSRSELSHVLAAYQEAQRARVELVPMSLGAPSEEQRTAVHSILERHDLTSDRLVGILQRLHASDLKGEEVETFIDVGQAIAERLESEPNSSPGVGPIEFAKGMKAYRILEVEKEVLADLGVDHLEHFARSRRVQAAWSAAVFKNRIDTWATTVPADMAARLAEMDRRHVERYLELGVTPTSIEVASEFESAIAALVKRLPDGY